MPKVLEIQGFIFYFYAADCEERMHIHVRKGDARGKIWLEPSIEVFRMQGFKVQEIRAVLNIIEQHYYELKESWNAYCSNR